MNVAAYKLELSYATYVRNSWIVGGIFLFAGVLTLVVRWYEYTGGAANSSPNC